MSDLSKDFGAKATPPAMMEPKAYQTLLQDLLTQGQGLGKTKDVGAYLLQDMTIVTETSKGEVETTKTLALRDGKEKAYLLLDVDQYTDEGKRALVVKDLGKQWAGRVVHERDLDKPDYSGPGIWVNKQSAVEFDYLPTADKSVRTPNPDAYRVCLDVTEPVNMPVQWDGGFVVKTGGTVAIRERDVPAVAEALKSIHDGSKSAEEALFTKPGVAKFDIYGMEPGFAGKNYGSVPLKETTQAIAASLSPAAPAIVAQAPALK